MRSGSGQGTEKVYSVEARYSYHHPKKFGRQLFDNRWQEVEFDSGSGVPNTRFLGFTPLRNYYLTYQAAQALRWWFLSQAESEGMFGHMGSLCLETRLVEYTLKYSYSIEVEKTEPIEEVKGVEKI